MFELIYLSLSAFESIVQYLLTCFKVSHIVTHFTANKLFEYLSIVLHLFLSVCIPNCQVYYMYYHYNGDCLTFLGALYSFFN